MSRAWYVLWTDGGKEADIASQAQEIDKVDEAIAPIRALPYQIDGKWEMKDSIVFSNYIFVHCVMDADVYHRLRGIPHVRGWLGVDSMWPTDVPANEMERVLQIHAGADPSQLIDNAKIDRAGLTASPCRDKSKKHCGLRWPILLFIEAVGAGHNAPAVNGKASSFITKSP